MATKLLVRRGVAAALATLVLDAGEPGWASDSKYLVVGDGSTAGGKRVAMLDVAQTITAAQTISVSAGTALTTDWSAAASGIALRSNAADSTATIRWELRNNANRRLWALLSGSAYAATVFGQTGEFALVGTPDAVPLHIGTNSIVAISIDTSQGSAFAGPISHARNSDSNYICSSASAGGLAGIRFSDAGTAKWYAYKDASNNWLLYAAGVGAVLTADQATRAATFGAAVTVSGTTTLSDRLGLSRTDNITSIPTYAQSLCHLGRITDGTNNGYRAFTAGYCTGATYAPVAFGYQQESNSGYTYGRFFIATRPDGTDVAPTVRVKVNSDGSTDFLGDVRVPTKTPASASAAGVAGTIAWDASYIYVCIATNTWKRAAIATW